MAKNQIGVTYLGLLFTVALGSIALAGTGTLWQMESRRDKEKELLFIGEEYRRAIASYYDNSPGDPQYPARLADLAHDPRFPMPVRHLRRLYSDPMSADGQWHLISRQGRIVGVASRSLQAPIKIGDFPAEQSDFEGACRYADWQFVHKGGASRRRITVDEDEP
ncbi:type II secretory pathway, pseudopilin PulG [Dechloromonas denitrificans]|uniref:Type II secretory pathway, pseudopilin PulG n=1 Tax=Dechloromonas denitrificans TaxID=281362 RepID=A0A133XLF5_9RHOO|nr:type II secretion system protein [Dechloromonas denitrificans]KXB31761.1 type II secretory pathway, pseudopilin PulG [Dechloromonas denitrificans]